MSGLKKIIDRVLITLVILSVLISMTYVYYLLTKTDTTLGVNYVGSSTSPEITNSASLTDEEKANYERDAVIDVSIYSNDKNNGIELEEMRINWFTDYTLAPETYRSSGMQYLGDYVKTWESVTSEEAQRTVSEDFTYYDTTDNISYSGYYSKEGSTSTNLNREAKLIIPIGGKPYQMQLTGEKVTREPWLGFLWDVDVVYIQTYSSLFYAIMQSVKSNSEGYGDYFIKFNLTDYFTFYEYDEETGKFKEDIVTDKIDNYVLIHFQYYENGATKSEQSLFGAIKCNSNWSYNPQIDTDYWQERVVYKLTNEQLTYRKSDTDDGYYVSFPTQFKAQITSMPRTKIYLTINMVDGDKNIIGIDCNGLSGVEIDTLNIQGQGEFSFLYHSLYETNLKLLNFSAGIHLVYYDDYIEEKTYLEVPV